MESSGWDAECRVTERHLLQCVVEVAKAAFRAEASSVFVVDGETGDLVFEAVAGRGEDHLVGTRFSGDTGIASWVVASGQPIVADDLAKTSFSQSAAERTGYVPRTIAAAPLITSGHAVGVLEVLDRGAERDELETLELLGLLSSQATAGIELLQRVRHASRREVNGHGARSGRLANVVLVDRIAARLPHLDAHDTDLLSQVLALADGLTARAAGGRA